MKIGFGTVIYKEALCFIPEFFASIDAQTYEMFTLLIVAEGIPESEQNVWRQICHTPLQIIDTKPGTPYYINRVELLRLAKRLNCDILVLGDCDDLFAEDRVSQVVHQYDEKYDFFYNKLIDQDMNDVFPQLKSITTGQDILEKNYVGHSNSALNMKKISDSFIESLRSGKTTVFDWYLFSRILENDGIGKLIVDTYTMYRIHQNNMAGMPGKDVERELQVKKEHYRLLAKENPIYEKYAACYANEKNIVDMLRSGPAEYWWNATQARKDRE